MKRSSKKGFTLIELIIVIAILAILAVVIIPKITGTKDNAQIGVNRTNAKQIQGALEQYYAQNDTYPAQSAFDKVLTDKIGKVPQYKNKSSMGSYTPGPSGVTAPPYTSFSFTFANDSGTSYNELNSKMYNGSDTNDLFK